MRRQRGLTLVELAIVIVIAGILVAPLVFVIHQIAISDSRSMTRVELVHDTRVLAVELRGLARDAFMRLNMGDAFEVSNNGATLTIYSETGTLPPPAMATIEFVEAAREIRITNHRNNDAVHVALENVVFAEFTLPNARSFEVNLEVERDLVRHSQRIHVHGPNAR